MALTAQKLPSGNFRCRVTVDGVTYSVTKESKNEALAEAMSIKAGLKQAKKGGPKKTVSEAIDEYIQSKSNTLSPSTICGYRCIQHERFKTAMQENIFDITERQWQTYCNEEAAVCSPKTLKNAWMFLSTVIYRETRQKFEVTLPQVVRRERPYLTPEQIIVFVDAVRGKPFEVPALLALCSLRRSEILGLRWKDIDLEKNVVNICGAAVVAEDQKLIRKETNKNAKSQRIVPILIPRLSEAIRECAGDPDEPVVTGHHNNLYTQINSACVQNGLPPVGVHGLRHSFASLAYHLNIPEKIAMDIGGWSDNQTMHKIYTHISEKDIGERAADIQQFFEKRGASTAPDQQDQKDAEIAALKKTVEELQDRLKTLSQIHEQFSVLLKTLNQN